MYISTAKGMYNSLSSMSFSYRDTVSACKNTSAIKHKKSNKKINGKLTKILPSSKVSKRKENIMKSLNLTIASNVTEEKESMQIVIPKFNNLQLLASGSASASTNNKNNNKQKGENEMKLNKRNLKSLTSIANAMNISVEDSKGLVKSIASGGEEVADLLRNLLYTDEKLVVRKVTLFNDGCKEDAKALENKVDEEVILRRSPGCKTEFVTLIFSSLTRELDVQYFIQDAGMTEAKTTISIDNRKGVQIEKGKLAYTSDVMIVDYTGNPSELNKNTSYGFYMYEEVPYLIRFDHKENKYLIRNGEVNIEDEATIKLIESNGTKYMPLFYTTTQEKHTQAYSYNATKYSLEDAFNILDRASGGAISSEIKELRKKGLSDEAIMIKIAPRHSMFSTGNLPLGYFDNIVYTNKSMDCVGSEYDSVNDINPSEDLGLERESKTYDGQATVSAHLIAFLLLKKYGILVNPNYLVGYDMQLRTRGAVCVKTFVDIVDIKQIKEKANAVKEFDPNYVFIGDESKGIVNAIFDGDAVKLANRDLFNSCEPVELLFLESAKAMGASLSPQILNSILAMEESFNNDGSNIVAEQLINKAKLEGERSLEGEVYSSISLSGNSQNIFFAVNRGAALTDRYAMNNLVGSLDKKIISSVSNIKVSAEGYSGRALFDNTSIFMRKALLGLKSLSTKDVEVRSLLGVREVEVVTDNGIKLVQAIEVYSPYLLDKYSDEIDAIQEAFESDVISIGEAEAKAIRTKALNKLLLTIGYKFPSVSVFENIPTVAVTDFELDEREEMYSIEGNDEFNRRLSLAKKWLTDRKAGTVVVAPEDLAKQVWAGMDTDFDSLTFIQDSFIVDIALKHRANNPLITTYIGDRDFKITKELVTDKKETITDNKLFGNQDLGFSFDKGEVKDTSWLLGNKQ